MKHPFRLDAKTALITGAASGIGEAIARVFAQAGAHVTILDRNTEAAEAVAHTLPYAKAIGCDVTDPEAVDAAVGSLTRLDVLVNCAAAAQLVGSVAETELEGLRHLFRVNVEGVFLVTKAALPGLLAARGSIINIGSVAGLVGVKRRYAYCATKGAIVAMTRQIAVDYPKELRVNCICPGTVDSPFVEGYLEKYHKHEKEQVRAELNARQPIGRLGRPDEIAHLALYMASVESDFMNGAVVNIDGGWTAA